MTRKANRNAKKKTEQIPSPQVMKWLEKTEAKHRQEDAELAVVAARAAPLSTYDAPLHAPEGVQGLDVICRELRIWRLCGRAACRRAGGCQKDPGACLTRYSPLVPFDARMWVAGILSAREHGVPLEEAMATLQPEYAALEAWRAIVDPPQGGTQKARVDRADE